MHTQNKAAWQKAVMQCIRPYYICPQRVAATAKAAEAFELVGRILLAAR